MESNDILQKDETIFQQFISGKLGIRRRIKWLIKYAEPMDVVEAGIQSIASYIQFLAEAPEGEKPKDAIRRYKLARAYGEVADYIMGILERDVYPALEKLHNKQFPEDKV
jgi:hypothetical protein